MQWEGANDFDADCRWCPRLSGFSVLITKEVLVYEHITECETSTLSVFKTASIYMTGLIMDIGFEIGVTSSVEMISRPDWKGENQQQLDESNMRPQIGGKSILIQIHVH